jgi:hypothetical protein
MKRLIDRGLSLQIKWIDYEWRLNNVNNRPEG